jgi:hypothetical protein
MEQTALTIGTSEIRQLDGLYSLNDFHKASGGELKNRPVEFMRLEQTQALISEIGKVGIPTFKVIRGAHGGTYACKELVIAYAAWISAEFHLKVIRVFLDHVADASKMILDAERMKTAIAFALEASKVAAQSVIEAFVAGEEPRSSERYLLSMEWDTVTRAFDRARVKAIDPHAYIASLPRLAEMINESDAMVDREEIVNLTQACLKHLDTRLKHSHESNRMLRTTIARMKEAQLS